MYNYVFKMRFLFIASIHGKQQFEQNYKVIEQEVKRLDHDFEGSSVFNHTPESMKSLSEDDILAYHKTVMDKMKQADAILIEASYTSTSIGFNLADAMQLGKSVIIFYSGTQEPHLFRTLEKVNERLQVIRYANLDELRDEIPSALKFASDSQNVRFNFFISPSQSQYLDWIAKTQKISRSVYLRRLISSEMNQEQDD